MLFSTSLNSADVLFDSILDSTFGVVLLDDIDLSGLSCQRTDILPGFGIVISSVKVSRKFEIPVNFDKWNSEGMAEILPNPLALRVEVLEDFPVVVLGVIDDFEFGVEIHRSLIFRELRLEPIQPHRHHPFRHCR